MTDTNGVKFSVMRKTGFMSLFVIGACLFIFSGLLFAADVNDQGSPGLDPLRAEKIEALSTSPKLSAPQAILEDFLEGGATTGVIVNLKRPLSIQGERDFNNLEYRRHLVETVRATLDSVIGSLDPAEVRVTNRFTYFPGFSAEVTLEGLEELVAHPRVLSIDKDHIRYAQTAQGIPLMKASTVRNTYNGSGMAIAICDTGIDYTHPKLGGGGFPNTKVIGGYDCGDDDTDPMDGQGHGTACAGIAAGNTGTTGDYIGGVAYNAKLYAVKIATGSSGSATDANMIEGWEWCITHQNDDPNNPIMIISTSFGGGRYLSLCDSESSAMTSAAKNAVAAGMTLFVSSGNDGYCDAMGWPACISHVNSVGAVYDADLGQNPPEGYVGCIKDDSCVGTPGPPCDEKWYVDDPANADQVTTYSNSVSFLTLFAPANWAYSTKMGGGYWDTANGFGGTSAACPYAAGAAACLQSAAKAIKGSYLSPGEVKSTLTSTGDSITDGKVAITKPRVNLEQAVASLGGGGVTSTWLGNTTAWNLASNWSEGSVPDGATNATIPKVPTGGHFPTVDVPDAVAKKLTLKGGPVSLKSGALTVGKGVSGPNISYTGTNPYDFGTVNAGSSLDHAFTVQNTGTATLNISGASVSGTGFSLQGTYPGAIVAGGSGDFTVRFSPASAGSYTGTLSVNSNDPDTPTLNIGLKGTGGGSSEEASAIFQNRLGCYDFPFQASLTIDGKEFISTYPNWSTCQALTCGESLNWSLYADAGACGIISGSGTLTFNCNHLIEVVLELDLFDQPVLSFYDTGTGDCGGASSGSAQEMTLMDSVVLSTHAGASGFTVFKPATSE